MNAKAPRITAGPDPIDLEVGRRLRVLRRAVGVTQAGLADALGLSFQQVQKYERGLNRISASVLVRCARALGCSVSQLVGEAAAVRDASTDLRLSDRERSEFLEAFRSVPASERRVMIRLMTAMTRPCGKQELSVRAVG